MRYPEFAKNVVDVTKAPYFADNSGRTDCTAALCRAIDDCLRGYIIGLEKMRKELLEHWDKQGRKGNVYIGAESGRILDGEVFMTLPEDIPLSKIIYFPNGTYLVSDTVTYTFDNLFAPQTSWYKCELCRNIHILGEDKESTIIRLADNAEGFEKGNKKPVLSFNKVSTEDKETTNCAMMNTLEDITVDCGCGNPGAIGVLYASSNCGRIENVDIKADSGLYGIDFDYGSEGCVYDIRISGFDYGMRTTLTSPLILDRIDFSGNRIAAILTKDGNINTRNIVWGDIPAFSFLTGSCGRYYVQNDVEFVGDRSGNYIFIEKKNPLVASESVPENPRSTNSEDWVCIDDFGAVGDGVTDCTYAIQAAMDSGKPIIIFGEGNYLINRTIKVPATVKTIDFMYGSVIPGYSLIVGEMDGAFDICEDSDDMFFAEHFMAFKEQLSGFFRFFSHSAKRDIVIKDFCLSTSLYHNSIGGSKVYIDNCFTHTNHYAQDAILHRDGYTPVFCKMIPVEAHNQKIIGKNLNIERGETEMLCEGGEVVIDGYKTEGPGMLVKTVNGGKTQLNLFNAGLWCNRLEENSMFGVCDASIDVVGGNVFYYAPEEKYQTAFDTEQNGEKQRINMKDCSKILEGTDALNRDWGRLIESVEIKR